MPVQPLFKFCFLISLCVHFSLGFLPFFATPPAHQSPLKYVEVFFLKNRVGRHFSQERRESLESSPNSRKVCKESFGVPDIPRTAEKFEPRLKYVKVDATEESSGKSDYSQTETIVERLEFDLTKFQNNSLLNLFSDYAQILRACILNRVNYPKAAFSEDIEGIVQLRFVLLPDGNLKDVSVAESSNCLVLDTAAIAAVEKATPFPPFPKGLRTKELFVKVPIIYRLN